jgi:predicted DsbA family dithiol-disulfide isomerase
MKVEIWSDIACPFCYIGKHHFEKAVESLSLQGNVEVEWKSFELDPNAQRDYEDDLYTLLANKYGQTRDWAIDSAESMKEKGKELGLVFNFDDMISTNTFNAHRLIHLAKSKELQNEVEEALFEAYFRDGRHIGNPDTLMEIGQVIGLKQKEIASMLNSDMFEKEVRTDEQQSQQFGIRGVPFFVINRKYGISGAQPISHFIEVMEKVQHEETIISPAGNSENACDIDGCN